MPKEKKARVAKAPKQLKEPRLAGVFKEATSIFGRSKGKEIEARVHATGIIMLGEKEFKSPSAAANAATKQSRDGWLFWKVKKGDNLITLAELTGRKVKNGEKSDPKPRIAKAPKQKKAKAAEVAA